MPEGLSRLVRTMEAKTTVMILLNKLIRVDLLLLAAVAILFVVRAGFWRGVLEGAGAALLFLSVLNHIEHYQRTKKLY
jgi:hypothetical protein